MGAFKKIGNLAARAAVSVAFAVCAFATTASGMQISDILSGTPYDTPAMAERLTKMTRNMIGDAKVAIIDIEQLQQDMKNHSAPDHTTRMRQSIIRQVEGSSDLDAPTKSNMVFAIAKDLKHAAFDPAEQDDDDSSNQKMVPPHVLPITIQAQSKAPDAFLLFLYKGKLPPSLQDALSAGDPSMQKDEGLLRVFIALHETRHIGQTAMRATRVEYEGKKRDLYNQGTLWNIREKYIGYASMIAYVSRQQECDADTAAALKIIDFAPIKGLELIKDIFAARLTTTIDGNYIEHTTFNTLSNVIHKYEPSFPAITFKSDEAFQNSISKLKSRAMAEETIKKNPHAKSVMGPIQEGYLSAEESFLYKIYADTKAERAKMENTPQTPQANGQSANAIPLKK